MSASARPLRIGTRGSELAIWQAEHVAGLLRRLPDAPQVELVRIKTEGDRILDTPLSAVAGKGFFTKEIEVALLERRVDFAVHSLKDLDSWTSSPASTWSPSLFDVMCASPDCHRSGLVPCPCNTSGESNPRQTASPTGLPSQRGRFAVPMHNSSHTPRPSRPSPAVGGTSEYVIAESVNWPAASTRRVMLTGTSMSFPASLNLWLM